MSTRLTLHSFKYKKRKVSIFFLFTHMWHGTTKWVESPIYWYWDLCTLKVDMPILTCIFFTFNWLTMTSEIHFVKFHPEVASCLLSRGKRKYAPLGMRLIWKNINYFLVYQLISHFLSYLQNYKEFKAKTLDLQPEKYGLSFDIKKCTTSGWALGDENVIGIRAFNTATNEVTKKILTDIIKFISILENGNSGMFGIILKLALQGRGSYQNQLFIEMQLSTHFVVPGHIYSLIP